MARPMKRSDSPVPAQPAGVRTRWRGLWARHNSGAGRDPSFFGHGEMRRQEDGAFVMHVPPASSLFLRQLSRY
jgi:hypothetical protein